LGLKHPFGNTFDTKTLNKLVDTFLEKGFTYFDTAYAYHEFKSEEAIREVFDIFL